MSTVDVYQTAINNMYTKVLYRDSDSLEREKKNYLLQILGFPVPSSPPTKYPSLVNSLPPNYDVENNSGPSLRRFYTNWNNASNISQFLTIFSDYITDPFLANQDSSIDANNVTNYFLAIFFTNNVFDIFTNTLLESKPTFVPEGDPNYTPLLGKIQTFFNFKTDPTLGVGKLGGDYINSQCMLNFKNYLLTNNTVKNNEELLNSLNDGSIQFPPYENGSFNWDDNFFVKQGTNPAPNSNNSVLSKLISPYRNSVSVNNTLLEWCGCFIPPSQAMFTALGTAPKDLSDISSSTLCDPLCIADQAVKRYSSLTDETNTNNLLQCDANICLMSNISINFQNSSDAISFEQLCNGCVNNPTKPCLCIMDISSMSYMNKITYRGQSLLNEGIFKQICPDSVCYTLNNGELKSTTCNSSLAGYTGDIQNYQSSGMSERQYYNKLDSTLYIFLFVILAIILLFDFNIFTIDSEYISWKEGKRKKK